MGTPTPIALGVRTNPARNQQAGSAQLINCFGESAGEDSKAPWIIYGTAGLTPHGAALDGLGARAAIVVNGTLYAVVGRGVFAVQTSGVSTKIGTLVTDGPVTMERNRRSPPQIGIVSGGFYHVIDTGGNTMTLIEDPDLPSPISISFVNGYGVLPIAGGSFMITALDDFTQIDGLDRGTAEAFPDDLVASAALESELVLYGEQSIEWHQDTGGADFPFTRVHATEIGCLAAASVAKVDTPTRKTLIWVAPDHTVRQMSGYSGSVISTNEIEELIKDLHRAGNISTLKGFAWADAGRFFYALTCDSWTRVYDGKSTHWHTRKSYGLDRWRVSLVIQFGDKLIAGDYASGQLYEMGDNYNMEGDDFLIMEIITPTIHAFPFGLRLNGLYMDAARGVGTNSTDVHQADPTLLVSMTKDGGYSFGMIRERSLGRIGQTAQRIPPIYRLGTCGQAGVAFKFAISAPVERVMIGAALDSDRLST